MAIHLKGRREINFIVSHHAVTQASIHEHADAIEARAEANLADANATHRITPKGYFPAFIDKTDATPDMFVNLNAPDAPALEFGHAPSGVFGPGGALGHLDTKAPEGRYILSRAAGLV
jgi:hypothetical protein